MGVGRDIFQVNVDTREWLAGAPTKACACLFFFFFSSDLMEKIFRSLFRSLLRPSSCFPCLVNPAVDFPLFILFIYLFIIILYRHRYFYLF
ncbi:hypothetical protein HOY82DRAFT_549658, partial [Tuber indicum]